MERLEDGQWVPAEPIGWHKGIDWEVYGTGPYEAVAYNEDICVAVVKAKWKPLLYLLMAFKNKNLVTQI